MTNKPKKILYIITKSVWGGAGKYVYDLATALPKDNWNVSVAAGGNGPLAKKLTNAKIPYFEIKSFQRNISIFKEIFAFFEILKLLFKLKPDIIHVNSSKAGGLVGFASFCYSLFVVRHSLVKIFTVHGWAYHEDRPKKQITLIKFLSRLTCLFYNKIICVSEYDKDSAIKNKITSEKKLITIHNGIKPEEYDFLSKETARVELANQITSRPDNHLWIGTIGENTENKGHKYLKRALKEAVIITDLPKASKYLKAFDIFILPSIKEGFPYILLEAGLAHLPIIATNVGGVPEIIINPSKKPGTIPTGLLVEPKSSKQLSEAIQKLTENSELKNELSYNLWQKVMRDFTFEKMLNATLAAY